MSTIGPEAKETAATLFQRGLALGRSGDLQSAIACYDQVLTINPEHAYARFNRGNMWFRAERHDLAVMDYLRFIQLQPGEATALGNLGLALRRLGRLQEALEYLDRAAELEPGGAGVFHNRANLLLDLNRPHDALADADRATSLAPDYAEGHRTRGNCFRALNQLEPALECFQKALILEPESAESHFRSAAVLARLDRYDEAIAGYDKAIAFRPDYVEARVNRSILMLLTGELRTGFEEHEWRYRGEVWPRKRWRGGTSIQGKSIVLHCDDGLGDTIQFCRYASVLADQGAIVTLAPQRPLMALMATLDARVAIADLDLRRPHLDFDLHCPLLSVPAALGTTLDNIPGQARYLFAEPKRVQNWAARLGDDGIRVGVCWQGSTLAYDVGRSFPVTELADISRIAGVRLISLHKGAGEAQLDRLPFGMNIEVLDDLDADGGAFLDTAAVMVCCDLVISSDTAVAHLAGALGVETWVALRRVPAWRWLLDRRDCPWYPNMRLFRQHTDGDWSSVFREIGTALRQRMAVP
jgi:tetratricopeptide (TPR) repeat protein